MASIGGAKAGRRTFIQSRESKTGGRGEKIALRAKVLDSRCLGGKRNSLISVNSLLLFSRSFEKREDFRTGIDQRVVAGKRSGGAFQVGHHRKINMQYVIRKSSGRR